MDPDQLQVYLPFQQQADLDQQHHRTTVFLLTSVPNLNLEKKQKITHQ